MLAQLRTYKCEELQKTLDKYNGQSTEVSTLVNDVIVNIGVSRAVPPNDRQQSVALSQTFQELRQKIFCKLEAIRDAKKVLVEASKNVLKMPLAIENESTE